MAEIKLHITRENFVEHFEELVEIISNSPEFKKLGDCTQMIFDKETNNVVLNRQTHTILVAEIARELAEKFGFDDYGQDMAYLIGLCHDLGHTAFGHTGESRIDKVLGYFGYSSRDFNNAYAGKVNLPELIVESGYQETEGHFEHHAQSRRVLRKILKDNAIIIDREVLEDLETGILCHSESRFKEEHVTKPLWTLARYADKFYAFTDVLDTIRSENYIPGNILERIVKENNFSKYLKKVTLTENDYNKINGILEVFDKGGVGTFRMMYVQQAILREENGHYYVDTETEIGRLMRILQGVMKYMRENGFVSKEEKLANAMVDEIIAYKIAHPNEGVVDHKEKVINACLYVSMATDTELREWYRDIAVDREWCDYFDEIMMSDADSELGFATRVEQEEREYIRKNPDVILNYYFNAELSKISDLRIRDALYHELIEYRENPTLKARRELIEKIEIAKRGENPFVSKKGIDR